MVASHHLAQEIHQWVGFETDHNIINLSEYSRRKNRTSSLVKVMLLVIAMSDLQYGQRQRRKLQEELVPRLKARW